MIVGNLGEPGSGKTHALLSLIPYAEKMKAKIGVIDVEGKFATNPFFDPLIKKGIFEVFSLGVFIEKKTMREAMTSLRMVPKDPQGYYRLADAIDKMSNNSGEYCVRVIDTFTEIQDHLKILLKNVGGKTALEYAEWELMIQNLKLLFGEFGAIGDGSGLNILNMHLLNEKDESTMTLKILPLIQGQFRDLAASYFHELYLSYVKDNGVGKAPDYMWRVRPNSKIVCRTNVFEPAQTDVKQDYTPLWTRLL
jgi:hypothetical protein